MSWPNIIQAGSSSIDPTQLEGGRQQFPEVIAWRIKLIRPPRAYHRCSPRVERESLDTGSMDGGRVQNKSWSARGPDSNDDPNSNGRD
ncbi:uncharacterized protein LAJ45_09049 [Morchella importuna]|uniref:uncharacterized protein n=1 Tax=Morchella importuna TaxID=1174673 RepID=UPI001E8ECC98|nr:uncharacterized protein LAJ45_09049 [Morchella importuna]KAH8146968.1 hypothetical protein LAJ45_09049 [Morchella importuna]